MLRKLLICVYCLGGLLLAGCDNRDNIETLSQNEVYFFYQESCPHCHTAAEYIKSNYPHLKIKSLDIKMPGNRRMFQAAAKTYKVGFAAGTPLICFGKDYIMGWGADAPAQFDLFAKKYQ